MTELPTLHTWLATLAADQLQDILEQHPLVLAGARVRTLEELASRLEHPATISESLMSAPLPVLEVLEAAAALGAAATSANLVGLLDDSTADRADHAELVAHWLAVAESMVLLWIDGEQIRVNPGVHEIVLMPLALGRPSRTSLSVMTSDQLARVLSAWHHTAPPRKAERWAAATELFADPAGIRRVAARAPSPVLETLTAQVNRRLGRARSVLVESLGTEPLVEPDELDHFYDPDAYRARQQTWQWATSAGLAIGRVGSFYGYDEAELPSEVHLALAPASFRAPFHPEPPPMALTDTVAEQTERTSAAAAIQFLGTAMATLEAIARDGIALLQGGGVGSRELNRYAKTIGTDVATIRLTITLAARLNLLDQRDARHLDTAPEFQTWRRLPPAQRVVDLVLAWMSPGAAATLERDADGHYLPALSDAGVRAGIPTGYVLARMLADLPGRAACSADEVAARLTWGMPAIGGPAGALACIWREAHLLGVLADGAAGPFTAALCHADDAGAREVLDRLLPAPSRQVMFGSDLTIVIPGNPAPDVVDVLDIVAHRESHGVANTWRVTDESIRDALDAGYSIDDLTGTLRRIAGGDLPQALDYLMRDIARRHGQLEVRPAGAVITATDPALLAEVVGTRRLRKLGLVLVAPTVAVADVQIPVLLRELRAAGYLPVQTDLQGVRTVRLRSLPAPDRGGGGNRAGDEASGGHRSIGDRRSSGARRPPGSRPGRPEEGLFDELLEQLGGRRQQSDPRGPESPHDAARRLLTSADEAEPPSDLEQLVGAEARHLSAAEAHELADAVATGRSVQITYISQSGGETHRAVSDLTLLGSSLYGYCHLRQAERNFRLDRILSVAPLLP